MKTAEELKITQSEYEALPKVRDALRAGELVHWDDPNKEQYNRFDLGIACDRRGCGTVACIGGWVWIFMHADEIARDPKDGHYDLTREQIVESDGYVGEIEGPLDRLYYPADNIAYCKITPAQAADAIDNFLEHGDPKYTEVAPDAVEYVEDED